MPVQPMLLLIASALLATAAAQSLNLGEFQAPSGGFREVGLDNPDLKATSNALFLSSLYGLKAQINADDAATYIQSHHNTNDFGYGVRPGVASDLESTRYALLSYLHLGKQIPDSPKLSDFIRSLFDINSSLFASRAGESGDLESTALAIEALDILGELKRPVVQDMLKRTKDLLTSKVVGTDSLHFSFDPNSASPLSDNYYALVLAKHSGFEFADVAKWAAYITRLQDLDQSSPTYGGFFTSSARNVATAESTAHAALSLHLLGVEAGNEAALFRYAAARKSSIEDTAQSHLAFAHATTFKDSFATKFFYDSDGPFPITDQVMEGLRLTPKIAVTAFDGRLVHGGFAVSVTEQSGWSTELVHDPNTLYYVSGKDLDTSDRLGSLVFNYELKTSVYPIGEIKFSHVDTKKVGYHVNIADQATFSGRSIERGGSVLSGTEFRFDLTFSTQSEASFYSGDFVLDFSVLDASNVVQHKSSVDGSSNTKPISLAYTLDADDFPAGHITFLFEVRNDKGVHTSSRVLYSLEQQLVAAHIQFDGSDAKVSKAKLGDKITVTFQPATLKDLHTIAPFSAANANKRRFALDLSSSQGETVLTVPGTASASGNAASYTFDVTVPANLDFIGISTVSFRFLSAAETSVNLHPFDAQTNELFEDTASLQLVVDAELHVSNVEQQPSAGELKFGTSVPLKFQVQDAVSGLQVIPGEQSSLAVVLRTSDGYESARVAAAAKDNVFDVTLNIDANAARGESDIAIVATGVDGNDIPVYAEKSKDLVRYRVKVGGDIEVTSNTYTTNSGDATETAFIATFTLTCDGKQLKNTHLRASVKTKNSTDFSVIKRYATSLSNLPVSVDPNGRYSFSFALPHNLAASGEYKIQFTRQVDYALAQTARDAAARKDGKKTDGDDLNVAPLFELSVNHKEVEVGGGFLQMELLVLVVLGGVYLAISSHVRLFEKKQN